MTCRPGRWKLLLVIAALSGTTSFILQFVWVQLLAAHLGSTPLSFVATTSSFLTGLGIGTLAGSSLRATSGQRTRIYALLQIAVAISGACITLALASPIFLRPLMQVLGRSFPSRFMLASLLMILPASLIGAAFAIVLRAAAELRQGRPALLSWACACNASGNVIGALATSFVLLPNLGFRACLLLATVIGLSCAALSPALATEPAVSSQPVNKSIPFRARWRIGPARPLDLRAVAVLFASGYLFVAWQQAWLSAIVLFMGVGLAAAAVVVAASLTGYALGGYLSGLSRHSSTAEWERIAGVFLLHGCLLALITVDRSLMGATYQSLDGALRDERARECGVLLVAFLITSVPTIGFGYLYPRIATALSCDPSHDAADAALGYSIHLLGALAAALTVIPFAVGRVSSGTILGGVAVACLGVALLLFLFAHQWKSVLLASSAMVSTILIFRVLPDTSIPRLLSAVDSRYALNAGHRRAPVIEFFAEEPAGVISVVSYDTSGVWLQHDDLKEAWIGRHPLRGGTIENLLGALPLLFGAETRSAFVLGFGGGTTVRALAASTYLRDIRVVETDPGISRALAATMPAALDILEDPRIALSYDDARVVLASETSRYDAIISQPSHPWRPGQAGLFTHDYFELERSRLAERGICAQWLNLDGTSSSTWLAIIAAFYRVFTYGAVFGDHHGRDLILIGSQRPVRLMSDTVRTYFREGGGGDLLGRVGIRDEFDILTYYEGSRDDAVAAAGPYAHADDAYLYSELGLGPRTRFLRSTVDYARITSGWPSGIRSVLDFSHPEEDLCELFSRLVTTDACGGRSRARRIQAALALEGKDWNPQCGTSAGDGLVATQ